MQATDLLIFGASVRAAAFSALRAGLRPWCADLFADEDLRAVCPAMRLPGVYPEGFLDLIGTELPGPWMYTGGLENRAWLLSEMSGRRPLWGNVHEALVAVRLPSLLAQRLREARLPCPQVYYLGARPPQDRRWLLKPLAGSGGLGIRVWRGERPRGDPWPPRYYLQEFIEGEPAAALYCADDRGCELLGVTRQLVGLDWLHARPFAYCGSVGPLAPDPQLDCQLRRLGAVLATGEHGLRGLFGVDGVVRDGTFWPVEVNPRYTASVEVIEHATGLRALAWHRRAFDAAAPVPAPSGLPRFVVGKAVLYARQRLTFPAAGPWVECARRPVIAELPAFADIPAAGTVIEPGHPVLSFFTTAATPAACEAMLRQAAADLDRRLYGR